MANGYTHCMDNVKQRNRNSKNQKTAEIKKKKSCNRNEHCLRLISRLDTNEERISVPEDMTMETAKSKKQREKRLKEKQNKNQNIQELWYNSKMYNIYVKEYQK